MFLSKLKSLKAQLLLPLLVFLISSGILLHTMNNLDASNLEQVRTKAELNAISYADRMIQDLNQGIVVTESLKQILISENGQLDRFDKVAADMMTDFIQSIQLAPNGVVTEIYPEAGNEAGKIDLIHDETRGPIARYGRDHEVIVMQGPFPLKQGGLGIAIRTPVYLEQEDGVRTFWGLTIAIVRVPEIFATSVHALHAFGYDYQLSKTLSPLTDTYEIIDRSGADLVDPVSYSFHLGSCSWKLEVTPTQGWHTPVSPIVLLPGIAVVLLLTGLTLAMLILRKNSLLFQHLSTVDPLTGLLNRSGFDALVDRYLSTHPQESCVCAALDIDDFKFINDLYGHSVGDQVLRQLADEMREVLPDSAILGRNGGDEFCVLLPNCSRKDVEAQIQTFAAKTRTFWVDSANRPFSISLGYTDCRVREIDRSALLRNADTALYEVKLHGKHGSLPYSGNLQLKNRSQLGFTLREVAQNLPGAFLIYYADPSNDRILFANHEMVQLTGCTDLDDFLQFTNHRYLISPEEQERGEASIWSQINAHLDGANDYVHFHLVRKDGTRKPVLDHGRIVETEYYGKIFYVSLMDQEFLLEHYE